MSTPRFTGIYLGYGVAIYQDGSMSKSSWMPCVSSADGRDWTLLEGFGRRQDAKIAADYFRTTNVIKELNSLSCESEVWSYCDSHTKDWWEQVCERLGW